MVFVKIVENPLGKKSCLGHINIIYIEGIKLRTLALYKKVTEGCRSDSLDSWARNQHTSIIYYSAAACNFCLCLSQQSVLMMSSAILVPLSFSFFHLPNL